MIYLGGLNPDTKDAVKRKKGRKCWEIVEGMWYHAGYYSTESLRHRGYWAGAEEEEGFIRHVSSCFLLVKVYHPVFTSCVLWTLGTYPLDGYSESQNLHSVERHLFHLIWKWLGSQKRVCTLAARREGLAFQGSDWLAVLRKWDHMGPIRTGHLEGQLRWTR